MQTTQATNDERAWITPSAMLFNADALYTSSSSSARRGKPEARSSRVRVRPDTRITSLVDYIADSMGIRRTTMHYHVTRESSYVPHARNPKSSATGLLQVVKGSHEAIIGRKLTKAEHHNLLYNPEYALRVGAAHIRACMEAMPGATDQQLWRRCHVAGHAQVGGSLTRARIAYVSNGNGWMQQGSVAAPWYDAANRGG